MDGIRNWIEAEGAGHWFFLAFPIVLLCLFIWFKERRVRFLIPSLLMTIVIVNPVFYGIWDRLGLYAYWRILWIVPVIPVVGSLVPMITERIHRPWVKSAVLAVGIGAVVLSGTFLYTGSGGSFVKAVNAAKLPDDVVRIADKLLELEDRPRLIAQHPVGVYIRQYSGEIDTLFGRNITGSFISTASSDAVYINDLLSTPDSDLSAVSQFMLDDGYDHIVAKIDEDTCFELIEKVGIYGLYSPLGTPTTIKQRDDLGQVISLTHIGENGNPIIDETGCLTTLYEYDNNGYKSRELHVGSDGQVVEDEKGIAGYEWKNDKFGEVLIERTLGKDQKPIRVYQNYAEVHREYKNGRIIKESFFDENGELVVQPAGHVAVSQEWDGDRLVSRAYLDKDDKPINRSDGYSYVNWENGDVEFYNVVGEMIPLDGLNLFKEMKVDSDGWTDWMTPVTDKANCCFSLGSVNLGHKNVGDSYSCQLEIEFKDVSESDHNPFSFHCQGSTDGRWDIGNIWNYCANLHEVPEDGVYTYSQTVEINEKMAVAKSFEIGFRCDNWKSGSFRVRKIKIEKNEQPSRWTPGI